MLPHMLLMWNGVYFLPIYTGFCVFHAFTIYFGYAFAIYAKCVHLLNVCETRWWSFDSILLISIFLKLKGSEPIRNLSPDFAVLIGLEFHIDL